MTMIRKIDIVLNNFLVEQGYSDELCACYEANSDSYYESDELISRVVLGGLTNKAADKVFMEYCKELGLNVELHVETLTFLHEVGHHITLDFLDIDEINKSEAIKMLLRLKNEETVENFMEYFTCPEEYEATWDAVKFCNTYPEVVKKLDKDIQEALYK